MVKPPSKRQSKSGREPVTIDQKASEAKITAATGDGGPFEGSPSGSASSFEDAKGTDLSGHPERKPATRPGETHAAGDDERVISPPGSQASHADAPSLRADDEPAQSSSEMLNADRQNDPKPAESGSSSGDQPTSTYAPAVAKSTSATTASGNATASNRVKPPSSSTQASAASAANSASRESNRRGAGFGSLLLAGIVGGGLAVGGFVLLGQAGLTNGATGTGASTADLEALRSEVADLRSGVEADRQDNPNADLTAQMEQLRADLASVQQQAGDAQALSARLDELDTQLQSVQETANNNAPPVDLAPINERIDQLEQSVQSAGETNEQNRNQLDQRLAQLQQSVDDLSQRLEERVNDPRLAAAITASALKAAIDRGQPFQTELEAYASVAQDSRAVETLRPLAESGVPTHADLAEDLPEVTSNMVAAARQAPESSGVVSRLWSSASNLVDVRPVGANVQGNEPGAIVARFEAAVKAGNYEKALSEYGELPEASKNAGAAFVEKLRARQTANDLIGNALSEALKA